MALKIEKASDQRDVADHDVAIHRHGLDHGGAVEDLAPCDRQGIGAEATQDKDAERDADDLGQRGSERCARDAVIEGEDQRRGQHDVDRG